MDTVWAFNDLNKTETERSRKNRMAIFIVRNGWIFHKSRGIKWKRRSVWIAFTVRISDPSDTDYGNWFCWNKKGNPFGLPFVCAGGGTRTPTPCGVRTWSVCVYQFRHSRYCISKRSAKVNSFSFYATLFSSSFKKIFKHLSYHTPGRGNAVGKTQGLNRIKIKKRRHF